MKRKEVNNAVDIMTAYSKGAEIEFAQSGIKPQKWSHIANPSFNWAEYDYQIKPKNAVSPQKAQAINLLFPNYNWLVMEECGAATCSPYMPVLGEEGWRFYDTHQRIESLRDYSTDWRESLIDLDDFLK